MNEGILDGVRILDLSEGLAGSVAAMLLAECGADVVLVEPRSAVDRARRPADRTWNRSKRSVVLDLGDTGDRGRLEQLLGASDVVIHQHGPEQARRLGLDDESLAARHPHLIASSVLSWPANHPDADLPVDELLAMARLGICDEQMPMRRDGPVFIRFPLGSWGAVYLAAVGIAARLLLRGRSGQVGPAHTSLVQGSLVPMGMHWSRAENPSAPLAFGMPKEGRGSQVTLMECADGVWIHLMKSPDSSPLMQATLGQMGPERVAEANEAARETAGPVGMGYPNLGANVEAMLTRPSAEWLTDFWANDIPAQPALPFGTIFDDEQAIVNGYVDHLDDPDAGRIRVAGRPLTVSPPQRMRGPVPPAGAHDAEVTAEWSDRRARPERSGPARRWPLEGVRVLDLGNYLAGPYAPMLLADLGADVVKVEATTGDAMRPTGWAFAGCQRGKRGVALDLKSPEARPALDALVKWADVVHHNLRMPAAHRLGIDYETLRALNPTLVYSHTSSYGPEGARADWPGYDQLFQAQCGWEVLGAGEGNPPTWHRFGFMDHQCALSSALATVLALYQRDRTGEGQAVAASLLGAGVLTASETFVRPDGTIHPVPTIDADQTGTGPGYRIIEVSDGWVAVAATTDEQVRSLSAVAGVDDPADAAVALEDRKLSETLAALRGAGVPAEEVRTDQRSAFFDSPANRESRLAAEYTHAEWGKFEQPGALWYFGDVDVHLHLAPPALGEHTTEVLREVGIADHEIQRLVEAGVAVAR